MAKSKLPVLNKKFIVSKLGENPEIDSSIIELVREALGMNHTLDWVSSRTDSNHRDTIFCAYIINGIVGSVNFFTPFRVLIFYLMFLLVIHWNRLLPLFYLRILGYQIRPDVQIYC